MDKVYQTSVYIGQVNGQTKRMHIRGKDLKSLQSKVIAMKSELANGKDVYSKAIFDKWADKWLIESKMSAGLSDGTITQYKSAITHINRYFGNRELKDIKMSDFQVMINELTQCNPNTGRPMAKATLENIVKVASSIFRYARSNGVAGVPDYFKDIIISKKAIVTERRSLTLEEQDWIMDTEGECQMPAMIMLFSGIRRGELIPLTWADIDFNKRCISINKSVEFIRNQPVVKVGGKSSSATRLVPIPKILVDYLLNFIQTQKPKSKYVCARPNGKMHTKTSFRCMWERYIRNLNKRYGYQNIDVSGFSASDLPLRIERFTPHYLRHTYATILYLQKIDVVSAKQYLGHADIQTTTNIYTDLENNSFLSISKEYKRRLKHEYKLSIA